MLLACVWKHIIVKDGVIDIWGYIADDRHRDAVRVAAENVPGVKNVRDHLLWIEPYSGLMLAVDAESGRKFIRRDVPGAADSEG
jgi:hypothetical protein